MWLSQEAVLWLKKISQATGSQPFRLLRSTLFRLFRLKHSKAACHSLKEFLRCEHWDSMLPTSFNLWTSQPLDERKCGQACAAKIHQSTLRQSIFPLSLASVHPLAEGLRSLVGRECKYSLVTTQIRFQTVKIQDHSLISMCWCCWYASFHNSTCSR